MILPPAHAPPVSMADFHYALPDHLIARYPASPRDSSRLLVSLAHLPTMAAVSTSSSAASPSVSLAAHIARVARGLHADRALPNAPPSPFVDCAFRDIVGLLPTDAHLVFNESRVFAARLSAVLLRRGEAADATPHAGLENEPAPAVEVLFLSPDRADVEPGEALRAPVGEYEWRAMVRADAAVGSVFDILPQRTPSASSVPLRAGRQRLTVEVVRVYSRWLEEGEADGVEACVRLRAASEAAASPLDEAPLLAAAPPSLSELLATLGQIPIPPYLRRDSEASDERSYQTVFASADREGSVAAPTAGLHFSAETLELLLARGVRSSKVALHVGAGTFRPVTAACIAEHAMHSEYLAVSCLELRSLADSAELGRPIVAVGTTSARALESLFWLGVRALASAQPPGGGLLQLGQWEAYELAHEARAGARALPTVASAFRALAAAAAPSEDVRGVTQLCIAPGYEPRVVSGLLTNLHQPDSTLLLLVGALLGGARRVHELYQHALAQEYRFLSYGDGCLLVRTPPEPSSADAAPRSLPSPALEAAQLEAARSDASASASSSSSGVAPAAAVVEREGDGGGWWGRKGPDGRRVLLHSCCAPCSGAMIAEMREAGFDVTIFFYNPNIHPRKEYNLRKAENQRFAEALGVPFIDADYDVEAWFERAQGLEFSPERGARCTMCFDMRMERTALHAHEHGFAIITTTNATSRWKDALQVDSSGRRAAAKYEGVEYWCKDWQTDAMSKRKYEINAAQRFYKQEYCGCTYSLRDSNLWRAKQGMPPIEVGSQDSVYSDPQADSEEESREVVDGFFRENKTYEEELRAVYGRRRKDAKADGSAETNNW